MTPAPRIDFRSALHPVRQDEPVIVTSTVEPCAALDWQGLDGDAYAHQLGWAGASTRKPAINLLRAGLT